MIRVAGKYFHKDRGIDLRNPMNYGITLDVDSIYESDMPIQRSDELILSAIHLQYKVSYSILSPDFTVKTIEFIIEEERMELILKKVNDQKFEKLLREGAELSKSRFYSGVGNALGKAIEIMLKKLLQRRNINYPLKSTLGNLISLTESYNIIEKSEADKLWKVNSLRINSTHISNESPKKDDFFLMFITIEEIAKNYF